MLYHVIQHNTSRILVISRLLLPHIEINFSWHCGLIAVKKKVQGIHYNNPKEVLRYKKVWVRLPPGGVSSLNSPLCASLPSGSADSVVLLSQPHEHLVTMTTEGHAYGEDVVTLL